MGKGVNSFKTFSDKPLGIAFKGTGNVVNAADGGNDPELISYTNLAIFSWEAGKITDWCGRYRRICWIPRVFQCAAKQCMQIMDVNVRTLYNAFLGIADRESVFDDMTVLGNVFQCDLDRKSVV